MPNSISNPRYSALRMAAQTGLATGYPTSGWKLYPTKSPVKPDLNTKVENLDLTSNHGQMEEGAVTDRTNDLANLELKGTLSELEEFLPGVMTSTFTNSDTVFSAVNVTGTGYTIPSATAAQATKFQYTAGGPISLFYAQNYNTDANNGLKAIGADVAAAATEIQVSGLTAETAPADALLEMAGIRAETGDLAVVVSGNTATLTSGNNSSTNPIDFTTLGLTVGQTLFIGGVTAANQFSGGKGLGTIESIVAGTIVLKNFRGGLVTDAGTAQQIDLLYGRFLRNVNVDSSEFKEWYWSAEIAYERASLGGSNDYEYYGDCTINEVKLDVTAGQLKKLDVAFFSSLYTAPSTTRKTGPSSATEPPKKNVSSAGIDAFGVLIEDKSGNWVSTNMLSCEISISRELVKTNVVGTLGPKYILASKFNAMVNLDVVYEDPAMLGTIFSTSPTISFSQLIRMGAGGFAVTVIKATTELKDRTLESGKPISLKLDGQSLRDSKKGHSMGFSIFPVLPTNL